MSDQQVNNKFNHNPKILKLKTNKHVPHLCLFLLVDSALGAELGNILLELHVTREERGERREERGEERG